MDEGGRNSKNTNNIEVENIDEEDDDSNRLEMLIKGSPDI
jgi:hypothetical protein